MASSLLMGLFFMSKIWQGTVMSKYRYTNQEVVEKHNMTSIEVKRSEYRDMLQNRVKREHDGAEACLKLLIIN